VDSFLTTTDIFTIVRGIPITLSVINLATLFNKRQPIFSPFAASYVIVLLYFYGFGSILKCNHCHLIGEL
jgi:hypothetical protein